MCSVLINHMNYRRFNMFSKEVLILFCIFYTIETKNIIESNGNDYGSNDESNLWSERKWNSILEHHSRKDSSEIKYAVPNQRNSKDKLEKHNEDDYLLEDELFIHSTNHANDLNRENIDVGKTISHAEKLLQSPSGTVVSEKAVGIERSEDENIKVTEETATSLNLNSADLLSSTGSNVREGSSRRRKSLLHFQRSFIFNPLASPAERFQNCTTPSNESGHCRYLQHCMLPSLMSSLNQFMQHVCVIKERFIGVCCPNHPASVIVVQKQKESNKTSGINEECGVGTNTRIIGGSTSDPKAWPWMVALLSKLRSNFFCGGVLINDHYVLTAAHCTFNVPNNEIIARVGEYDFRDDGEFHEEYAVTEIKRHGQYNRRTLRNDIALLKLEKPVVFGEFVKTICFPEVNTSYGGENATLAGWGKLAGGSKTSVILQEAAIGVISNEECSKAHGLPIEDSLICTDSKSGKKGACSGDSGGPLMLLDNNTRWKVIGLVSWGRRGCDPEYPTVYTRVSHFMEWIKNHAT